MNNLSLLSVILININIMFGTGIFINTVPLMRLVGAWGGVSYALIALFITPLVFCFSALIKKYPDGGMYTYAYHAFGKKIGFASTFVYFLGKLASAALLLEVAAQCLSTLLGGMDFRIFIFFKLIVILFYMLINTRIFSSGRFLMYFFLTCKIIPILAIITCCLSKWHFFITEFSKNNFYAIPGSLPIVLYAFTGFEACCSVSGFLAHPKKDAPKALLISFGSVIGLTIIYQTIISLSVGNALSIHTVNLINFFPLFFKSLSIDHTAISIITPILYSIIASACLGGVYAILLSNYWNLHRLAQENLFPLSSVFSSLNDYKIPHGSVILEGMLCMMYVLVFQNNIALLQQLSVMGCALSYAISTLSLIKIGNRNERIVSSIGLCTCILIFLLIIKKYFL